MACLAAFFDVLPQHEFIIEATLTIEPDDPFNNNVFTGTGVAVGGFNQGLRAQCRGVFRPHPTTIWRHFVGSISPYFFTVFVVFLAVAPSGKKYNGNSL